MKVILKEKLPSLGDAGICIEVKDGYARNHLFPRGLAVLATPGNLREAEALVASRSRDQEKIREEAEALKERLSAIRLRIPSRAGKSDKLFGSITPSDIAQFLSKAGVTLSKRLITLKEPIKNLGEFRARVDLHPEIKAEIVIEVVREEKSHG